MDPSLKLPPVHALFLPFASDRVGLRASIWQRGDLSFYDGAGTARIGGSGWRRLLAGVPQCFRRISVLHAAY